MSSGDVADDLPARSASQRTIRDKEGLILMPIRQNVEEVSGGAGGKLVAFGVLFCLWVYYGLFGWLWLALFEEMGDDLLWAYFGLFCVVATSMGLGVAKSMSAQRIGWWRRKQVKKDQRGTCCGFQVY